MSSPRTFKIQIKLLDAMRLVWNTQSYSLFKKDLFEYSVSQKLMETYNCKKKTIFWDTVFYVSFWRVNLQRLYVGSFIFKTSKVDDTGCL